jgi:tetratricopeptide (TPR) repeat protein
MSRKAVLKLTVTLVGSLAATSLAAQDHLHDPAMANDQVHFPVSCDPEVQPAFSLTVAKLHSFEYDEARRGFQDVAQQDPTCGMAHWGVAMTYNHPLWAPPTPNEVAAGSEAARRAATVGAGTDRERSYIAAINAFYADADRVDHGTRSGAYTAAMERTTRAFPQDDEAAIWYALSLLGAAPASDPGRSNQKQAAAILEQQLAKHPQHPGIVHYTIHAFDYPELAELALPAARIYSGLAASPHALHMPTHIFTRLGLWNESIALNLRCRDVANQNVSRNYPGRTSFEALHCQDYLAYAHLQIGEEEDARRVLERVTPAVTFDDPNLSVGYALPAIPARYALELRDWDQAAGLTLPGAEVPWQLLGQGQGSTFFANAIGAARNGDVARARVAVERLAQLQTDLALTPPAGPYDWAGQVESMRLAAAGWLAFAEGRSDEAVRLLRSGAEKEEAVGKHPVTPGPILPARELLGDLLLELNRPAEALLAYEAALADSPRRFNGLAGAARSARAAGDMTKATEYYDALVDLAGASNSRRPELAEAMEFLHGGR